MKGRIEYLVLWVGYSKEDASWVLDITNGAIRYIYILALVHVDWCFLSWSATRLYLKEHTKYLTRTNSLDCLVLVLGFILFFVSTWFILLAGQTWCARGTMYCGNSSCWANSIILQGNVQLILISPCMHHEACCTRHYFALCVVLIKAPKQYHLVGSIHANRAYVRALCLFPSTSLKFP